LVLKNIRSQWFGQTDVVFERLRRVLEALGKVIIMVDEADTQFGGVGPEAHETERRLTGKVQQMMSDPKLRGRVIWLLMTARIHLLSPDIRRPGRVGDLIIPVLDPEGEDRREFVRWMLSAVRGLAIDEPLLLRTEELTRGYSAAAFASLRSHLKAKSIGGGLSIEAIEAIVQDHIPPAIELTRRYQTLQALVNCTRRSLLPDPQVTEEVRQGWHAELRQLEALGAR
jgi:SpoVK/Ycf46/Vps4 family AAA+-type ATPase